MANKPANQKYTIAQIAAHLNATALGDATLIVDSVAEPKSATKTQLALALDKSYANDLLEFQSPNRDSLGGRGLANYGAEGGDNRAVPLYAIGGQRAV